MLAELLQKIDENQIRINRYRPFEDKEILREIQKYYRVDSVFSSNALEGSSYTLVETKILLEDGLTAGGKPLKDALAVVGLGKAYDHAFNLLRDPGLTKQDLLRLHGMLEGSLEIHDRVVLSCVTAGRHRKPNVRAAGPHYTRKGDIAPFDCGGTLPQGSCLHPPLCRRKWTHCPTGHGCAAGTARASPCRHPACAAAGVYSRPGKGA